MLRGAVEGGRGPHSNGSRLWFVVRLSRRGLLRKFCRESSGWSSCCVSCIDHS